ncbi:MAG: hypothetical protein KGL39_16985 [Patescibacteria group bacterium]|nr:hypothetical protein [Patescibacteria group bacterium]
MNINNFILKSLQLALIADQAYEETQAPGATPSTVLQPNNFSNLLTELAVAFAPAPAAPVAPATIASPAPIAAG